MESSQIRPSAPAANISGVKSDWNRDAASTAPLREDVAGLVERARRGERAAFGDLYRLYYPAIYRLARFSLGEGAEDAAAETFLRAWRALPKYKATGAPFVSWLYGIARHVVADELRARRRTVVDPDPPQAAVEDHPDDRLDLLAGLARLPARQRQVIEMKYLIGLTNPEVAAALGISVGAVNAKQWRALNSLKRMLER